MAIFEHYFHNFRDNFRFFWSTKKQSCHTCLELLEKKMDYTSCVIHWIEITYARVWQAANIHVNENVIRNWDRHRFVLRPIHIRERFYAHFCMAMINLVSNILFLSIWNRKFDREYFLCGTTKSVSIFFDSIFGFSIVKLICVFRNSIQAVD